jgi:hypothetical protein
MRQKVRNLMHGVLIKVETCKVSAGGLGTLSEVLTSDGNPSPFQKVRNVSCLVATEARQGRGHGRLERKWKGRKSEGNPPAIRAGENRAYPLADLSHCTIVYGMFQMFLHPWVQRLRLGH